MNKTAIANHDEKLDIMDHLNQDHLDELLVVANYYGKEADYSKAAIADIFEEGVLMDVSAKDKNNQLYVPFTVRGTLEEKILYLAYYALTKQGVNLKGSHRKFFEVSKKSMPSKNMMRIEIKSASQLPDYYAAYTYGIALKSINRPQTVTPESQKKNILMRIVDHVFLWLLRTLSSKNRMKLVTNMNRDIRLYTLRFSKKEVPQEECVQGAIDVYLHGESPGGLWIRQLKEGDIIFSRTEVPDRHQHLHEGKNILIADETAFPALAGILELWKNPEPPIVLALMRDVDEQSYFSEVSKPEGTQFHYLWYEEDKQAEPIINILKTIKTLDGAWGGLEREAAKEVRHYIRNVLTVEGMKNHIKGYWAIK